MRARDWSAMPLGPPRAWPQPLKTLVAVMLRSRQAMFVAWGPARTMLYNDAYASICGPRHPAALGAPFAEVWSDIMDDVGPILERAFAGDATHMDDIAFTLHRKGQPEEAHFSFSYTPVEGDGGSVEGVFCACTETTSQVLLERGRHAAEARARAVLASITDGFMAFGRDWRFTELNSEAEHILGRASADLVGRNVWDEYPGLSGTEFERIYRRAAGQGEPGAATAFYPDHDRWYEARAFPAPEGISVFFRDVTPERRAAEALRESEWRSRLALAAAELGIWEHDLASDVVRLDARSRAHYGIEAETPTFAGLLSRVHPEDLPRLRAVAAAALDPAVRGPVAIEYRIVDGEAVRWLSIFGRVDFQASDGALRPVRGVGTTQDITARKSAEAALRESEAQFRTLADAMPQMVWSTRPDGFHDYYNARWYEFTGMPAGSTDGEQWNGMFHPDDREEAWARWRRSLATGEPYEIEYRLRRRDGIYRWVLGRALPLRDAAGAITRWFGSCTDIDDAKQAAEVLARGRAELECLVEARTADLLRAAEERRRAEEAMLQAEKLAALGQLTGGVAHDFNNLLQVVSSGAQLLRRPGLPEARKAAILDGMVAAGQTARDLTSRLLAFARHQALAPQAFDLNARLLALSQLLRQTLGGRTKVTEVLAPDLWAVHCDPGQLEVALLNLAVNARDAMPGGGDLTVRTRNATLEASGERKAGDYVCLVVEDTGTGMSPTVLARVFEPFFTTKGVGEGSGLGLAQVFGFARQSGGDVSIESQPGRGTTVVLHLPRWTGEAALVPAGPGAVIEAMQSSRGRTVLVVEDNEQAGDFAAQMLQELGYRTLRALDAGAALALMPAEGHGIDAVFSDIVMPGAMSGIELAAALRRSHPGVAIVMATGYSARLATGAALPDVEVLAKPYRLDDLAAALARALGAVCAERA